MVECHVSIRAESSEDVVEPLLLRGQGGTRIFIDDLCFNETSFSVLPFIAELQYLDQVGTVPLQVGLRALVFGTDTPLVLLHDLHLLFLRPLVFRWGVCKRLDKLRLRRQVSLHRWIAQDVPHVDFFFRGVFLVTLITHLKLVVRVLRVFLGRDHELFLWGKWIDLVEMCSVSLIRIPNGTIRAGATELDSFRVGGHRFFMGVQAILIGINSVVFLFFLLICLAVLRVCDVVVFVCGHLSSLVRRRG